MSSLPKPTARGVRAIRAFHALGRRILAGRAEVQPRASEAQQRKGRAVRPGTSPDRKSAEFRRKARAFAHPEKGYTKDELTTLCKAIRDACGTFARRRTAVGVSHVIRLLSVKKAGGLRAEVQRAMLAAGWSVADLDAEIRRRFGRRRQGGRRPRAGGDVVGQLEAYCQSWRRWYEVLVAANEEDGSRRPIDGLSRKVRGAVNKVDGEIGRLHALVRRRAKSKSPG